MFHWKILQKHNVWYVVSHLLHEMINWKNIWTIYKPLILEPMTTLKLSKVKSLMNWSLRTIAEFTMPATLGRDLSFSLRDNIWSSSDMSIYTETKNIYIFVEIYFFRITLSLSTFLLAEKESSRLCTQLE